MEDSQDVLFPQKFNQSRPFLNAPGDDVKNMPHLQRTQRGEKKIIEDILFRCSVFMSIGHFNISSRGIVNLKSNTIMIRRSASVSLAENMMASI